MLQDIYEVISKNAIRQPEALFATCKWAIRVYINRGW
jgi:hypothetical protein